MGRNIPMPSPTSGGNKPLTEFKVLSFDVYGSLIEYKAHILRAFQPLLLRLPSTSPYRDDTPISADGTIDGVASVGSIEFLKLFQKEEDKIKLEKPLPPFDGILAEIWRRIAKAIEVTTSEGEALHFGSKENIASWPVFPGTIDALHRLSHHYKLVALSNIDKYAWNITKDSAASPLAEVQWWKVFTAEDFGQDATRADDAKLETLVDYVTQQGVGRDEVLHVAQSLGHDHAPAKRQGIRSAFLIGDGPKWGKDAEHQKAVEKGLVGFQVRCNNLVEFADVVDQCFSTGDEI